MLYQIALTMIYGVGSVHSRQLLEYFGTAEAIFSEKERLLEKVPGIGAKTAAEIKNPAVLTQAESELAFMEKNQISGLFITDNAYPYRLRECVDAPLLLYSKGNIDLNKTRTVSIVGTRNATSYGRDMTEQFVSDLCAAFPDIQIISGLAFGIDIFSHKAALKNNLSTVAVLAHGLDRIYPGVHRSVAIEMLQQGGLLTDYPSGTNPDRQNFVKRNRIVAGLADATIVIESAEKGGSLITADIAFSYSRDVFAFPGKTSDPQSRGCNKLIKLNKAGLITSAADFISAMNWEEKPKVIQAELSFTDIDDDNPVTSLIRQKKEMHINDLAIELEVTISELSVLLFELEMEGKVKALPGGRYRIP
ncbi:DNA-processing protein DprA [Massilibacteroides sp.]|uniref:DNA-processing protein DprA n=1 Tax=Massilibacteroides sp. TaxID=2034766 RepID=UPI00262F6A2A|nr:DNA-processing protein DprA [Massilibacteroides sp.]MDD4516597.1 DNA-processing protein DprA [Massilibacteroides sp.]